MPDPIRCPNLERTAVDVAAFARARPGTQVELVHTISPSTVASSCSIGAELISHGWRPPVGLIPIDKVATLASAAFRLDRTVAPAALARWS